MRLIRRIVRRLREAVGTRFCSDCGRAYETDGQTRACAYLDDMERPDYAKRRAELEATVRDISAFHQKLLAQLHERVH